MMIPDIFLTHFACPNPASGMRFSTYREQHTTRSNLTASFSLERIRQKGREANGASLVATADMLAILQTAEKGKSGNLKKAALA